MAPRPSAKTINVATEDLHNEATSWSRESDSLSGVTSKISTLKFNRAEAGLFQLIVSAHSEIIDYAADRCREGVSSFTQISNSLKKAADTYEYEDQHYANQLNNLW